MSDETFKVAAKLRLGLPVQAPDSMPKGKCAAPHCKGRITPRAEHVHTCKGTQGSRNSRHALIVKVLLIVLRAALRGFAHVTHEPVVASVLTPKAATDTKRRADIGVTLINTDRTILLDLVVRHAEDTCQNALTVGATAEAAEAEKMKSYDKDFHGVNEDTLVPIAIETNGYLGNAGLKFIKHVVSAAAGDDKTEYDIKLNRVLEALSVAQARCNAETVLTYLKTFHKNAVPAGRRAAAR
jgi:hypothetical protein